VADKQVPVTTEQVPATIEGVPYSYLRLIGEFGACTATSPITEPDSSPIGSQITIQP
jgi:hypothetical protein